MTTKRKTLDLPKILPYRQGIHPNAYTVLDKQAVSSATLKSYKLSLDNLRRTFNSFNHDELFLEPKVKIKKIISKFGKTYYLQKTLNVWNKYLTVIEDTSVKRHYAKALTRINERLSKDRMKNERKGKVEENWVDYDKIVKLKSKLRKEGYLQDSLLIAMYTMIPPVRNDYWNLKVRNFNRKKDNYYLHTGHIVLNDYKTFKWYGKVKIKLPAKLDKALKANISDSDFLFLTEKGLPYTATNFTKYFQNIMEEAFDKRTNFQQMRNIFLTHLAEKEKSMTLEQIKKINQIMGHNLEQSLLYRKFVVKE